MDTGVLSDRRDATSVQRYDIWREGDTDAEHPRRCIYPKGEPEELVLWQMASSFRTFRDGVRLWQAGSSGVDGCIDLTSPCALDDDVDLTSSSCPVLFKLEELRRRGWTAIDGRCISDRMTKVYSRAHIDARRDYLEVLLKFDAGEMTHIQRLPSDQPQSFFKCLNKGYDVPMDKKASWYNAVLQAKGAFPDDEDAGESDVVVAPARESGPRRLEPIDEDCVQDCDPGDAIVAIARAARPTARRRRAPENAQPPEPAQPLADRAAEDLAEEPLALPPPPGSPAPASPAADGTSSNFSSSSASSSSDSDASGRSGGGGGGDGADGGGGEAPAAPGDAVAAPRRPGPKRPDMAHPGDVQDWLEYSDGVRLRIERRPEYHRLAVTCPHHAGCSKRRGTGAAQRLRLGDREPLAYLGAWLADGPNHTPGEHIWVAPSLAMQRAWLDAHPEV